MQSKVVKNELVVGTFIAIGVAMGGVWATKRSREKGLLDTRRIHFEVTHGSGLQRGAPVLMRGVEVGSIGDVQLTDDHKVRVSCDITPRFAKFVREDTKAKVVEPPFLGTTKVELEPGTGQAASGDHQVEGRIDEDFTKRLEKIETNVDVVVKRVDGLVARADKAIEQIDGVTRKVSEGEGLVARLLNDAELANDAKQVLADVRAVVHDVREGKGALAMVINDAEFAGDLKQTARDVREVTEGINKGEGSLGRLAKDSALVDESTDLVKDVRSSLAKLDELNVQARSSMSKVESLLTTTEQTVKRVEGLVGSADGVTKELADAVRRVNSGEGTVAALLNDDAVYRETKSLLKELRESVEDLREQAPINSFLGVVFSAF